jgi:uncharacterized protein YndB with AHSA1/START domain
MIMESIMEKLSVTHSTFVIERSYPVTPERVFAAFADPAKKRRWYAEGGSSGPREFEMDFRVGGSEHSRFKMSDGTPLANDTSYQDIEPNRRIVFAYTMSVAGRRISASLSTIELLPTDQGTDFIYTEQAAFFEGSDGATIREAGWSSLFEQLEKELAR